MRHFTSLIHILCVATAALSFCACSDDDDDATPAHNTSTNPSESTISAETVEANRFVWDVMETYYYWNTELPNLNYKTQPDTEEFFYNLLSSKDRFSFISDDADELLAEFDCEYTAFGIQYSYTYLSEKYDTVAAVVTYVYSDTPASNAGIKRGDLIYKANGTVLNHNNYSSAFSSESGEYEAFRIVDGKETIVSYSMTKALIVTNPVAEAKVIERDNGQKVGYLLYMSYSDTFNDDLVAACSDFQSQGVSDVVLDLRYNTGGDMTACECMIDLLAPASVISSGSEALYYEYNETLRNYQGYDRKSNATYFSDKFGVNLDLDRLVVLTGPSTYSASEATIWSLMPYMDVTLVGDTTGGKNTAMFLLQPSDFYFTKTGEPYYSSSINNWIMAPIVAVYKNSTEQSFDTSMGYGLAPDVYARDLAGARSVGLKELGDPEENLLAAALGHLDGTASNKAIDISPEPRVIGSSLDSRKAIFYKKINN